MIHMSYHGHVTYVVLIVHDVTDLVNGEVHLQLKFNNGSIEKNKFTNIIETNIYSAKTELQEENSPFMKQVTSKKKVIHEIVYKYQTGDLEVILPAPTTIVVEKRNSHK